MKFGRFCLCRGLASQINILRRQITMLWMPYKFCNIGLHVQFVRRDVIRPGRLDYQRYTQHLFGNHFYEQNCLDDLTHGNQKTSCTRMVQLYNLSVYFISYTTLFSFLLYTSFSVVYIEILPRRIYQRRVWMVLDR